MRFDLATKISLVFLVCFGISPVIAQETTPLASTEAEAVALPTEEIPSTNVVEETAKVLSVEEKLREDEAKVQPIWTQILEARKTNDIKKINGLVFELEDLRIRLGISNFENFSSMLLSYSQQEIDKQNRESAAFYVRKALQLSPSVPALLFQSGRLAHLIGTTELNGLYSKGFKSGASQYQIVLSALVGAIYPILWALTLGFVGAAILYFSVSSHKLLRSFSTFFPARLRGFVTFPLVLCALVAPLWFGPLWCVAIWSLLAIGITADRQWLTFAGGCLLCLWGFMIPLREHGAAWISDGGTEAMLRVASGIFQPGDEERLRILVKENPQNAAANFALGQALMRRGLYEDAKVHFSQSSAGVDDKRVRHQLAILAFLSGDTATADKTMAMLEQEGLDSAAFYFNFSKVRFDLLETESSREYFDKANALDPAYMTELQAAEEKLGFKTPITMAVEPLPLKAILKSALTANTHSDAQVSARSEAISGRPNPSDLALCGVSLILLFFMFTARKRLQRGAGYYAGYKHSPILYGIVRLIPAGALALKNQPLRCLFLCSFLSLLMLPLLEWPVETRHLIHIIQGFELHYTFAVWFLVAACTYLGFYAYEDEC